MFPQIPFTPGTTKVTGFSAEIGKKFVDKDGNTYVLNKLHTALLADVTADGHVMFYATDGVATNVAASAEDTTNPRFAGIAMGATAESVGTDAATVYYDLHLVNGRKTGVKCAASVAIGDGLTTSTPGTATDAEAQRMTKATTTALAYHAWGAGFIGVAVSAVASGTCTATIRGNL